MPLKLIPPRKGKSPFWSVRGTYLGVNLDRSTKTPVRTQAGKILRKWQLEIESGAFSRPGEPTFFDAAVSYMAATGNERFVRQVLEQIGKRPLRDITQELIDQTAIALYPNASPATRNRQVHTVVSAVLKHAGIDGKLKRPKGWRGTMRTDWLKPKQAFQVFEAAHRIDPEFSVFLTLLCYTGMRLSDALELTINRVELSEGFAYVEQTKNEDPRGVFLPPVVVAALASHPRGLDRRGKRVFRFTKCGRLYKLLKRVKAAAGPDIPPGGFHLFCHTWATWMRRYAGADESSLIATGRWRDPVSVKRYMHVVISEEARKASLLPVENPWKEDSIAANPLEKQSG